MYVLSSLLEAICFSEILGLNASLYTSLYTLVHYYGAQKGQATWIQSPKAGPEQFLCNSKAWAPQRPKAWRPGSCFQLPPKVKVICCLKGGLPGSIRCPFSFCSHTIGYIKHQRKLLNCGVGRLCVLPANTEGRHTWRQDGKCFWLPLKLKPKIKRSISIHQV